MARYTATVPSTWPPETAFAYLSSFDTVSEWDPGIKSAKRLPGGPAEVGVGTRFEVVSSFLGRDVTLIYEITEFDAAARHVVLVGKNGSTTSIDTIDVAASEVTYDAKLEFSGPLKVIDPLMHLVFQRVGGKAKDGLRRKLSEPAPQRSTATS